MPSMTPTLSVSLSEQEEIGRWLAAHGTPQQVALRGRIVLGAAAGQSDSAIARQLGTNRKTVMLWRRRFSEQGSERLWEVAPGLGRTPKPKPPRVKSFKLSRDPRFLEKLTDVVGLYLNPPQQALVLCVDEKSQIQALDRTQPGLPLKKGRCGTMTHDYKRNGTTTLFAALELLQGRVIGQCYERHRHQ